MPDDLNEMIRVAEARQERAAAAFQKYDTDASGEIDQTEVLCLLKDLGMLDDLKSAPADFLASGFAKYDVDDSGTLSFEEFKEFYNAAVDNSKGHVSGLEGHAPTDNQKKKAALAEAKVSQKSGKLKQSKSGKLPQSPSGSLKQFETAAASAVEVDEMSRLLNSKLKPAEQREWFKIFGESARDLDPPSRSRALLTADADSMCVHVAQSTRTGPAGSSSVSLRTTCAHRRPMASASPRRRAPTTNCRSPPAAAAARLCSHCASTSAHASCPRWQAVWVALDVSNDGCLKSKEFGSFMRRGQSSAGEGEDDWKTRLQRKKSAEGAAVRASLSEESGRATNASFVGVKPAGEAELERMSKLFNGCLDKRPSHLRDPHKLWGEVDMDGSGRIQYDEFGKMVRAPSLVEPMHAPVKSIQESNCEPGARASQGREEGAAGRRVAGAVARDRC